MLWDTGCKNDPFQERADNQADHVIPMDLDYFAMERLYRQLKAENGVIIMTLVQSVADPSPN